MPTEALTQTAPSCTTPLAEPSAQPQLTVQMNVVCLDARVNVEQPTPDKKDLVTRGLLRLQLLDARAALRPTDDVAPLQPDEDPVQGMLADVSLAHVGMQDLQACVEQRHVLGVSNPFGWMVSQHFLTAPACLQRWLNVWVLLNQTCLKCMLRPVRNACWNLFETC